MTLTRAVGSYAVSLVGDPEAPINGPMLTRLESDSGFPAFANRLAKLSGYR